MARLGEIQLRGSVRDIDQVMNYLYQLEEQIRYALNNLDGDNIRDGAISAEQLSGTVNARLSTLERAVERMEKDEAQSLMNGTIAVDQAGIRLLNGAFSLNEAGQMTAQALTLPEGPAAGKSAFSLPFRIFIGTERPEEENVLWFRPGQEENGAQPCQVYYIGEEENT